MPNAKNMTIDNIHIKGLVKGDPKTGKTTFVGTWPSPFFFIHDNGIKSLLGQDINYKNYSDADPEKPTAFTEAQKDLTEALKSAKANGRVIYDEDKDCFHTGKVPEGPVEAPLKHIETICVDCGTPFLEQIMAYVQASGGRGGQTPAQNDWYPQMSVFTKFMDKVISLPCHVWLTTYEKIQEIKKGDVTLGTRILPALTGGLGTSFGGRFDCIFRTSTGNVGSKKQFKLQAAYQGMYEAGHRFGTAFDLFIDPPTYENVMANIKTYAENKKGVQAKLKEEKVQASK